MLYKTRTALPKATRVIKNTWIPLADGSRLAARIWMPVDAETIPVPGIFEYIPYRKNDVYAEGDQRRHGYTAAHGYACVRVDLRGSGDSDGVFEDEYSARDLSDGAEVIAWIARQPWCTGKVGMIGLSWGGFHALEVAALKPPALAAVISQGSSDDRYSDDVHYVGGCFFARYNLHWANTVLGYMARPPDPLTVGDRWRQMWTERLEGARNVSEPWITHQTYDEYWKHGSVCEDYSSMTCPIYMVGSWQDGYTNSVLRMLENYRGPCKGLIGPWGHQNPYYGVPGPAIGYLQEALRWWDYWLKGIDNGVMAEPRLRFFSQDAVEPAPTIAVRAGRWASEPAWPSPNVRPDRLTLGDGTLGSADPSAMPHMRRHVSRLVPAGDAGNWAGWGHGTEFPGDQRAEDGQSLTFDSKPQPQATEILGRPKVRLELRADRPLALVAVRLCDVDLDGRSTLITRGFLNLTHYRSRENPEALNPNETILADVELKAISYTVPVGHRIRVAVSGSYWPWTWPSPETVTLSVFVDSGSVLDLPVRSTPEKEAAAPDHFAYPEAGPGVGAEIVGQPVGGRVTTFDHATLRHITSDKPTFFASVRLPDHGNLEFRESSEDRWEIVENDPLSAKVSCRCTLDLSRGDWRTRIETESTMTSTKTEFLVTTMLQAFESDHRIFARTWTAQIPRKFL